MKPKTYLPLAVVTLAILGCALVRTFGQSLSHDHVYNEMVAITGTVTILNHSELGVTPDSGAYLVFQRADCKRCLVATHADANGKYKVIVGRGKYKVIYYNPSPPTYDLLAPDQPRYVTATKFLEDNVFDIRVLLPWKK